MSHRKPLSLLYSVRYRRAVSLPLTSLVSHRKSLSLLLPLAAVELISPTGGGHYLSSVRSSHLTRSTRDISQLTDKKSPFCTLFDIGALFRSRSHPLYLTESRSPLLCHWQRSSLFLPPAAVVYSSSVRSSRLLFRSLLRSKSARCFAFTRTSCFSRNLVLLSPATGSSRTRFFATHR